VPAPVVVDQVVDAYLRMVDAEVAGLVEGLYLVGSVALGDFRPRGSDIDFVASADGVTNRPAASGSSPWPGGTGTIPRMPLAIHAILDPRS
jgi:hypothetical protein